MFYYIEGNVAVIDNGIAVIDVGGVGYKLFTSMNTLSHLTVGSKARLYTYCNIKEDAFDIFGFFDMSEKRCFELLLTVSGVGPKAALSILSSNAPESLAMAIISDDEKSITRAAGVGKKLAQRVILELKDKMSKEAASVKASGGSPVPMTPTPGDVVSVASSGLAVLGYTPGEIAAALRSVDTDSMSAEEIIKAVLKASLK